MECMNFEQAMHEAKYLQDKFEKESWFICIKIYVKSDKTDKTRSIITVVIMNVTLMEEDVTNLDSSLFKIPPGIVIENSTTLKYQNDGVDAKKFDNFRYKSDSVIFFNDSVFERFEKRRAEAELEKLYKISVAQKDVKFFDKLKKEKRFVRKEVKHSELEAKEYKIRNEYGYQHWYNSSYVEQDKNGNFNIVVNVYLGFSIPSLPSGVIVRFFENLTLKFVKEIKIE